MSNGGCAVLILSRKIDEILRVGDDVTIKILSIKGSQVRIGIEAPRDVSIHREEVYNRIADEKKGQTPSQTSHHTVYEIKQKTS